MKTINYKRIDETLYYDQLENGLKVYILKKENFSKTYGLFSTKFGSIDTTFIPLGEKTMVKVPDGVAHFLEHKMFELEDGDASYEFAKLGASTNAFTSSSRTAYLFNTASHEKECIELLLDFVQDIHLTDENIEKEKGIINQEINMYDDDPDWRYYFGSIQNLYHNHPIKVDIAGTNESVNKTTKKDLERCYHTFYHPSNMILFLIGDLDIEETFSLIQKNQELKSFDNPQEIIKEDVIEPRDIFKQEEILKMDVIMPKVMMSLKVNEILKNPIDKLKREVAMNLLLDILYSESSVLYEKWIQDEIINDTFGYSFTQERDYCFIQIGGDTKKPQLFKSEIQKSVENIDDFSIDEDQFERVKKKNIGSLISLFNNLESTANLFSRYLLEDVLVFDLLETMMNVTLEDVESMKPLLQKKYMSCFIIEPK